MTELQNLLPQLQKAKHVEDIFGLEEGTPEKVYKLVQKSFRKLAKAIHKGRLEGKIGEVNATECQRLLNLCWTNAQAKIKQGSYGNKKVEAAPKPPETPALVQFSSSKYFYTVAERICSGGTCGIFRGTAQDRKNTVSPALFRVPHSGADNDLLEREARAFDLIKKKAKSLMSNPTGAVLAQKFLLRLPHLLESVSVDDGSGKKVVNAFLIEPGYETGWYTLEEIRKAYPSGISTKIMTFIWNRILEGLTLTHSAGVVHGSLTPNHILIHTKDHLGQILDWTASCRVGSADRVPYMDGKYTAYFPDEIVHSDTSPSPASDIYMSAWCMVYILGGSPEEKIVPDTVEVSIKTFLNQCLQPKRARRPQTVAAVHAEFLQITKAVFGPRRFVELKMV